MHFMVPDSELDLSRKTVNPKKGMEYVPQAGPNDPGNSDRITRAYLDSILLVYRHIGAVSPSTDVELFGRKLATPIMASTFSGRDRLRENGSAEFAAAMKRAGAFLWTGWTTEEPVARALETGVDGGVTVKPLRDLDGIFHVIERSAALGAAAVCMDIDHCFDDTGADCAHPGGDLSAKSIEDLKQLVAVARENRIAFILKGIQSPVDAVRGKELGFQAVMASHHRSIWCYAAPPAMMLPEIRAAVGPEYPVLADCGVKSGVDVYKYLASGANAVGVARELMVAFGKAGGDGAYDRIMFLNDELKGTMAKTAQGDISSIDSSALRFRRGW